jgi:hypothetical protein
MSDTNQKANDEKKKLDEAIEKANKFCEARKAEKDIREFIADITAKLSRANLSAEQGEKYAKRLVEAFQHLRPLE